MNNNELFNQNLQTDEGVSLQDYTPEQLEEMFEERKAKQQKAQINQQKKKSKQSLEQFKNNYFSYYDDIKIPSHKVQDW